MTQDPRALADPYLDALSRRQSARNAQVAAMLDIALLWWARLLLVFVLFVLLVGYAPLNKDGVGEGGLLRQVSFTGMAALALPLIVMRLNVALALLWRSWAILLVFAVIGSTAAWSPFASVTIVRLTVMVLVFVAALGIASVLSRPRDYLPVFAGVLAAVLFANVFVALAFPELTFTEIGFAGLHPSKNLAGMVGQVMAVTFAGCLIAVRRPATFWALAALTLLALAFLALTQSKTALALAVVAVFGVVPALALWRQSATLGILSLLGLVVAAGVVAILTGTLGLSSREWAGLLTGDPTLTQRADLWRAAWIHIEDEPILGHGFGAVWSMWPQFHPLERIAGFWTGSRETLLILNQSHNGYLDLLLHGGIYLFAAVMVFVVKTLIDIGTALFRPRGDAWDSAGHAIFGAFFLMMLASNVLESTLFFPDGLLGNVLFLLVTASTAWRYNENARHRTRRRPDRMWHARDKSAGPAGATRTRARDRTRGGLSFSRR